MRLNLLLFSLHILRSFELFFKLFFKLFFQCSCHFLKLIMYDIQYVVLLF